MKYLLVNADDHTLDAAPRLALMRGWLRLATHRYGIIEFGLCSINDELLVHGSA